MSVCDTLVFDSETTGLKAYQDSKMFSLAICDEDDAFYFNFKPYPNLSDDLVLSFEDLKPLTDQKKTWIAHNAKFDLHFMNKAGICPQGEIIDTEVFARLFENTHFFYSLDACAKRWLGLEKDDRVKAWMEENNAYDMRFNPEGKSIKHYYFDLVPFEIISEYAMKDAEITWALFKHLRDNMYENTAHPTEIKLTSVLFEMEKTGVKIDKEFCQKAYDFHSGNVASIEADFRDTHGCEFTDSAKFLGPMFRERGFELPKTKKNNDQITDEVLSGFKDDALAQLVLKHRDNQKRATTYFSNYLNLANPDTGIVHPNFRQSGTKTGRMSCNSPNLQNIPTDDDSAFPIRRAFVPREGFVFVSVDYAQMEFRLMLEYANQGELIEQIKDGHDPHDTTAELTGLDRKAAKTLNFAVLYGVGAAKLGDMLGVSADDAKNFKWKYFGALPKVKQFIRNTQDRQKQRGFVWGWTGRRYLLETYTDPETGQFYDFAYKAANSIIQGGCADICKKAMVEVHAYLKDKKSRMLLQIHDEICLEVHKHELSIVPRIQEIMEKSYEAKNMPMACSVAWSDKSLGDLIEGLPLAD